MTCACIPVSAHTAPVQPRLSFGLKDLAADTADRIRQDARCTDQSHLAVHAMPALSSTGYMCLECLRETLAPSAPA